MSDDLAGWLAAQIDADERIAEAAVDAYIDSKLGWDLRDQYRPATHRWLSVRFSYSRRVIPDGLREYFGRGNPVDPVADGTFPDVAEHIAEHDPARELREVEAKRRRLARHQSIESIHGAICGWCSVPNYGAYQRWPCPDIRDDASVYAGRPGWREEWAA